MSDVGADALGSSTKSADSVGDSEIDLAGVGLGGDGVGRREASLLAEDLVELDNLVGVALEELQEGSLGTGGALGTTELKSVTDSLDVLEVHHQLLDPLGSTLANGDELGLFVVSVTAQF